MSNATNLINTNTETNTRAVMLSYTGRFGGQRYIELTSITAEEMSWIALDDTGVAASVTHVGETEGGVPVTMAITLTGRGLRNHADLGNVHGIRASVRFLSHSFDQGYEMGAPIAAVAYEGDA